MYSFESSGSRGGLHAMVIASFAVAVVLFSLSGVDGIPYPLIFQTVSIFCLVAAVYLLSRYSLRMYRYSVEPNGIIDAGGVEQCDLVITETVGKKIKVVARVALRDIGEVAVIGRGDRANRQSVKRTLCHGKQVFRYANTPVMAEECYIEVPNENSVIVIPADTGMTDILQRK